MRYTFYIEIEREPFFVLYLEIHIIPTTITLHLSEDILGEKAKYYWMANNFFTLLPNFQKHD